MSTATRTETWASRSGRTLSMVNPLEVAQHHDDNEKRQEIAFSMNENVYTLLLCLYSRHDINNQRLDALLVRHQLRKIWFFAIVSYLVQMFGFLYIMSNWLSYSDDTVYVYDCHIPDTDLDLDLYSFHLSFNASETSMPNQQCSMFQRKVVWTHDQAPSLVFAKLLAVFMLLAFLSADFVSVPRILTLVRLTQSKQARAGWFWYGASQTVLVVCVIIRIMVLIMNSDNFIDVLTVGISFIILSEIDDKMYEGVKELNVFGDDLFRMKIDEQKTKQNYDTIFSFVSMESLDIIILTLVFATGTCSTALWLWWAGVLGEQYVWAPSLIQPAFALPPMIAGIIFPLFPQWFSPCLPHRK